MRENDSDSGDGWPQPHEFSRAGAERDADLDPWYHPGGWDPGPPPRSGHRGRALVYLTAALLAAVVGAGLTVAFAGHGAKPPTGSPAPAISLPSGNAASGGAASGGALNQVAVERKVEPGLVDITAALRYKSETAEGTGMIVSASGLVLTNNHVIDGATEVKASLAGQPGRSYPAQIIGYDANDDVALLKLTGAPRLAAVSFGDSSQVSVGTPVLALGDAQGRGVITPAAGDISALNRSIQASDEGSGTIEDLNHMLQTNAQIQQGDSGGALADSAGQVIGMVTAANTSSRGQGRTMGYAIPIDTALTIARKISAGQASTTVYIGLPGFLGVEVAQSASPNPQQQAAGSGQQPGGSSQGGTSRGGSGQDGASQGGASQGGPGRGGAACVAVGQEPGAPAQIAPVEVGALILGILCGTAAQSQGLAPGDVITSVNGQPVTTPGSLTAITARYHPGAVVSVGWLAIDGSRHTTQIMLGSGPAR
jgi:S1-C subfamily serine protease